MMTLRTEGQTTMLPVLPTILRTSLNVAHSTTYSLNKERYKAWNR